MVAAGALLGLSACGGGGEEPAASAPAPAPTAPAADAMAPAPAPAATTPAAAPAAAPGATLQFASFTGDATAGQRVFAQCRTCHAVEAGVNRVGPSLHAIVGRTAGSIADYNYSAANKASGKVWNEQTLFEYLEDPRAYIPGTKMSYVGLKNPQQRADVIAYLKTQA
ncbi:cytochrome c family protein [Brevundimonas sp. LM2]|uniref:c-type cytochrome n=1 Tax=Brevundimonas sp. LM2 TaxID=1938605 RepID=UPI00209B3F22|nr:cytochrome c family protein [Brevundimonas sp. LM2]